VAERFNRLTADLPPEPEDRTPEQAAKWLLAHALAWPAREEKVKWHEFFRMKDISEEDLYDERTAIAGLVSTTDAEGRTERASSNGPVFLSSSGVFCPGD
jgi:hypothetical protein